MATCAIGHPIPRSEDDRLLRGEGCFIDDIHHENEARAFVVRSPYAHATIKGIEVSRAQQMEGVLGVFVSADVDADGLGDLPCLLPVESCDGRETIVPPAPPLARERVHHVGEPVALVVAVTENLARDAGELVDIDYGELPVVADVYSVEGSAHVWESAPDNRCFVWQDGDAAAVTEAFARADHITTLKLINNRVVVHPMEPRGALAIFEPATKQYTLTTTSQGTGFLQSVLADHVFRVRRELIRVVTPDVGGAFGTSLPLYAEQVLVMWAARKLGRPVQWCNDRSQSFVSDTQGRDQVARAQLAVGADGRFLALRAEITANMGAFLSTVGPAVPTLACKGMQSGVYRMDAVHITVRGMFTNTVPVDAYRGAGNPETQYMLERLIDVASSKTGIDPIKLRQRNMITAGDIPYTTVLGHTYDSGDFVENVVQAETAIDAAGFEERRKAARHNGRLRGIGYACHIKPASGAPFGPEGALLELSNRGRFTLHSGSQSTGQGHETAFAQMVALGLNVPLSEITVRQGDSHAPAEGHGTSASRSMVVGGSAVHRAIDALVERGLQLAAKRLEVAIEDLSFESGHFRVSGTDVAIGILELAATLDDDTDFSGHGSYRPSGPTYPNGCHACEVEIDAETGAVSMIAFVAVDDYGTIVNPLLLAGQVHGGVVQGIGQALFEHARYDRESGQPLTGSLMDYALPRALDVPSIDIEWNGTPCTTNPLGVKGGGESGCVGAAPAVVNAVVDALAGYGIGHIDMPIAAERVWRAMRSSQE